MLITRKTALNRVHRGLKAKMAVFAGWELPLWFNSIIEEHKAVRSGAGVFDVSHMSIVQIKGKNVRPYLNRVQTRSIEDLHIATSQYSILCLEDGGILDDLWIYHLDTDQYLMVLNAGNIEHKLGWLTHWSALSHGVAIQNVTPTMAMLAVQGPAISSLKILQHVLDLPRFGCTSTALGDISVFISRTGYSGEDGFEIIVENAKAEKLWDSLLAEGVRPCGLGARDSLRLEAGMLLSGQDINADTNPYEVGLGWLVDFEGRDFVGKQALQNIQRQGAKRKLVGFKVDGQGIARSGHKIIKSGQVVGQVTSGCYAPSLNLPIGLGYLPTELARPGTEIEIQIRNKLVVAHVVSKPFYKKGGLNES